MTQIPGTSSLICGVYELPQGTSSVSVANRALEVEAEARRLEAENKLTVLRAERGAMERDSAMRAAESWMVNGVQVMNQMDWQPPNVGLDGSLLMGGAGGVWMSNVNNRYQGRDWPFIQTDLDIAAARGMARYVCTMNAVAAGIELNLKNYVIRDGFTFSAGQKKQSKQPKELVGAVQDVLDDFFDLNHWQCNRDREIFFRSHRDGEVFITLYPDKTGRTRVRITEPEQIYDPGSPILDPQELWELHQIDTRNVATNWTFGVHKADHDTETVYGYSAQFGPNEPWIYLPAQNVIHWKRNRDCNISRGLSSFACCWEWLLQQAKLLRNTGEGAAKLAAIAYIVQHAMASAGKVMEARAGQADYTWTSRTQAGNVKTHYVENKQPGTVLDVPKGQEYLPGPSGAERGNAFLGIVQGILRQVGTRFAMTEGMVSGDDSNNSMASMSEAGSRFHTFCVSEQGRVKQVYLDVLWRVLWFAYRSGRFQRFGFHANGGKSWAEFKRDIPVTAEPPDVDPKQKKERTEHRQILAKNNVLSRKTWQNQEGLDHEEEDANIDNDKHPIPMEGGGAGGGPGQPGGAQPGGPQQKGIPGLSDDADQGGSGAKPAESKPDAPKQHEISLESGWHRINGRAVYRAA